VESIPDVDTIPHHRDDPVGSQDHQTSENLEMRVGLIGAGLMGRGMGHRLLSAGHALAVVAHRHREAVTELCDAGATEYATPCELATASDVVLTCLPGIDVVEAVLFDEGGVVHAPAGKLVIDCTTSLPDASRDFARRLQERGHQFIDAPVTGGPAEALAGKLIALVGGERDAVECARPVLSTFCADIQLFGGVGFGHAAKLINNGIGFGILGVVSEAIATAMKHGVDMRALLSIVERSGGQNRILQGLGPWILHGDSQRIQVNVSTACKDVAYYMRLAKQSGTDGPVLDAVLSELRKAIDDGLGPELLAAYPARIAARSGVEPPSS